MKKRGGGSIVNIASIQGLQSMKGVPAYAASKGGMLSLTRQLALDYAEENIRVLAVNPGTTNETCILDDNLDGLDGNKEEIIQTISSSYPMKRIGEVKEIANVVLFLSSDKASFMTGEYVNVDGGIMAKGNWG